MNLTPDSLRNYIFIALVIITIIFIARPPSSSEVVSLNGAGSSFIYPLMSTWIPNFQNVYRNISVNYQSIGSGGGIRAIIDGTVDFAASDAPLNSEEYTNARDKGTIMHLPITIGAAVIAYNIPKLDGRLILSGEVVAKIYLGEISRWNDPAIRKLNPKISLPDKEIIVVKRSDGSGTTYMFTDYLSHVSDIWAKTIGKTKIFDFPTKIGDRGIAAKGNEGVTGAILQNPYSIGYIELTYALQNNIPYASLKNKAGNVVEANSTTISAAARSAYNSLPDSTSSWENVSIVNQDDPLAYPLSSFVYILVYLNQPSVNKANALKRWLSWITTNGQLFSESLHYAPLPESIINKNLEALKRISASKSLAPMVCCSPYSENIFHSIEQGISVFFIEIGRLNYDYPI